MDIKEFEIPADWGHIAVKLWGDIRNPSVLVVHGILDNAGSFDRLLPLLPRRFSYICIDLPGCGKSSHFPPHLPIHTISHILVYKLVTDYFKKDKYFIVGHSYGGQLAFLFERLYPERVEGLIMLDGLIFYPVPESQFVTILRDKFDTHLQITKKLSENEAPLYTYEEAVRKIMNGRGYTLKQEAAEPLVKRMLTPAGGGLFKFTVDQRLKNVINPLHNLEYVIQTIKHNPTSCPMIIILAIDNTYQYKMFQKLFLHVFNKNKKVIIKEIKGNHDVHNEEPEKVAPHIIKFLETTKSKL